MLCHAGPGGSSRIALRLAEALDRSGHAVSVIPTGSWRATLEPVWSPSRLAQLERRVEARIRDGGARVVHYHYAWPFALLVRRLKHRLGADAPLFVGTLHGTDVTHTDVLTTVSQPYAALAVERLGLTARPTVVPNFVRVADIPPSHDFVDAGRRPRLVHVSNFRAVKDPRGVAEVFARVRKEHDAELWLVGDGPELPHVRDALCRYGVERDVRVLGYRTDVGHLLSQCDVLVMSSLEESFCLAALEAMAAGLAVVGSAVGGFTELAQHGRSALLYEPRDYAAAAQLVGRVLADRAFRLSMRSAAAQRALSFSVDAAVEQYAALYRPALAESRVSSAAR